MTKTINNKKKINLITHSAIMLSTALVLSYLESFLPPLFPGIPFRWGLSNVAVMFSLLKLGFVPAIFLALGKGIFNLAWSPIAAILSVSAGLSSVLVMTILQRTKLSLVSISIFSALSHNFVQIILVSILLKEFPIKIFIMPLLIISIFSGFISATLLNLALKNIKIKGLKSTLVFFLIPLFFLTACSKPKKEFTRNYFNYFDTISSLQIYSDKDEAEIDKIFDKVEKLLDEENKLLDNFREYDDLTNLYTINQEASKSELKVDKELFTIIKLSKELASLSDSAFTPLIGSYSSIWQKYYQLSENGTIIDNKKASEAFFNELALAKSKPDLLDLSNLILDENNSTIYFKKAGMKLDLGAVAKGYVSEKVSALLRENGIDSAIINLGGNVKVIGKRMDRGAFQVGINNPYLRLAQGSHKSANEAKLIEKYFPKYSKFIDDPNNPELAKEAQYLDKVSCDDNQSVVSSGIYERFFFINNERYSHLLDPSTGKSANKYLGITVVCDNSFLADALSTALFNLSIDEGKKLIEKVNAKLLESDYFDINNTLNNEASRVKPIAVIWYKWDYSQEKENGDIIKSISPSK